MIALLGAAKACSGRSQPHQICFEREAQQDWRPSSQRQAAPMKDRPLRRWRLLLFPENRENNREFLKTSSRFDASHQFWRPFMLQSQLLCRYSLFRRNREFVHRNRDSNTLVLIYSLL